MLYGYNFKFFKSYFLPLLRKNARTVENVLKELITNSLEDLSFFFTSEFLRVNTNLNLASNSLATSFLIYSIRLGNPTAVKKLIEYPNVDLNSTLFIAFTRNFEPDILRALINHPSFNINYKQLGFSYLQNIIAYGDPLSLRCLLEKSPDVNEDLLHEIIICIHKKNFMVLKIFLQYLLKKVGIKDFQDKIQRYNNKFGNIDAFNSICDEVLKNQS